MIAARGRWWAPLAATALSLAFALSGTGSIARAAVPPLARAEAAAVGCTVFIDSPLVGVPADMVYHPTDGRIWFTEVGASIATISAIHPSTNVITRYSIWNPALTTVGKGINTPQGITVGPDGALWFTGLTNNRIGRITTSGLLSFYPPLSADAVSGNPFFADIATGADGNLWITAKSPSSVYRLTPSGAFTPFSITTPGSEKPWGIAAAPDGKLWVAAPGTNSVISFVPGASPSFTNHDVGGDATSIVVNAAGQVWFTMPGESKVGRVIPGPLPVVTTVATQTPNAVPDGITVGVDGGIWFTEHAVGQIGRADPALMSTTGYRPAEQIITLPDPPNQAGPGAIVALPDGTIWFGEDVRKIAHFTGTAAGAVPLPPQATVVYKDGPTPVLDLSTGTLVYSTSTVLEVRASGQGVCIDQVKVDVAPCATGAFRTIVNVSAATATFQLLGEGCWTIRVTVTGPGGTTVLPNMTAIVNESFFPDTVDPILTVPANITVPATSTGGATVSFTATATDNAPGVAVTCTPPPGSVFTIGTTTVSCTAVDAAGNEDSGSFTVTVTVPAPTITVPASAVPASITVPATGVTTPVPFIVTGQSIVDSQLTVTCIVPNVSSQTTVPGSLTYGQFTADFPPLFTTVTCTASDLHGQSVSASFTVNVTLALPTISAVVTYDTGLQAGTLYVFGSWTRENVRVHWVCPSVATTSCPADKAFDTTGPDQSVTGTTTDAAGRPETLTVGNIDIDKTVPSTTCTPTGQQGPGGRFALSATVGLSSTDPQSGVKRITYRAETFAYSDPGKTTLATTSTETIPSTTVNFASTSFVVGALPAQEGESHIFYTVEDNAGNLETGECIVTVVHTIETTTTITSVRTLQDGRIEVTARVTFTHAPAQVVPAGHLIVFGTTTTAVTVTAAIGANGTATAILPALVSGEYDITARFGEQMPYLASVAVPRRAIAAQATSFVIWGGNSGGVQLTQRYQFWGSQWTKQVVGNKQSFNANSSFKGWGGTVSAVGWSTKGGNTTEPKTVARYITVIVTTATEKDGSADKGNVAGYAVLRVDDPARYAPNPGHQAFGTVVQAP